MEAFSIHQHLISVPPNSLQSRNNVSNTSSGVSNVTPSFISHGQLLDAGINFGTTMVSTSSTPTPTTQTCSFYLLRDDTPTPLETNDNLLVQHGFDQTYQKSKKVKESLSSFLPYLPGVMDEQGGPENSLRSVVDKPPIGGKELLPLTGHSLSGFRLNPGPIPEQFRFMSQHPVKKKHRHKKHKGQDSERSKDATDAASQGSKGPLEQDKALATSTEKPEGGHDTKKHKKQKKHEDGERKKKKKDKKKKKRHTPDATPTGGLDPG
ncbi:mediator of RNA polymerase II transcription subunit 19-like [Acropora millepora]|uniref:mediator of RNA polymerase II transcription subunit 19-like n=1 Tax=Acropora millepora TaxID=45264 RepID=UPI0010FCA5B7|nr:mediator of RNA polymerase II transcription subunit 19-like [Acropora millepora]